MPPKTPTREDMKRAQKEIGENIPEEMLGLDTEDVGDVETTQRSKETGE